MKARLTLLLTFIVLNCLSCSQENELDKAINEAIRDKDLDQPMDESVSVRYYTEDKAR